MLSNEVENNPKGEAGKNLQEAVIYFSVLLKYSSEKICKSVKDSPEEGRLNEETHNQLPLVLFTTIVPC